MSHRARHLADMLLGLPHRAQQLRALRLLDKRFQEGRLRVPERDLSSDKVAWRGGRSVGKVLLRLELAEWDGLPNPRYKLTELGLQVAELVREKKEN